MLKKSDIAQFQRRTFGDLIAVPAFDRVSHQTVSFLRVVRFSMRFSCGPLIRRCT